MLKNEKKLNVKSFIQKLQLHAEETNKYVGENKHLKRKFVILGKTNVKS